MAEGAQKPWVSILVAIITALGGIATAVAVHQSRAAESRTEDLAQSQRTIDQLRKEIADLRTKMDGLSNRSANERTPQTSKKNPEQPAAVDAPNPSPERIETVKPVVSKTEKSQTISQFSVTVRSCRWEGDVVQCALRITNQANDRRRFDLLTGKYSHYCRIVTPSGEYRADRVTIGNKSCKGCQLTVDAFQNVPMEAELGFPNVPSETSTIAVLELVGGSIPEFEFRNIPITR